MQITQTKIYKNFLLSLLLTMIYIVLFVTTVATTAEQKTPAEIKMSKQGCICGNQIQISTDAYCVPIVNDTRIIVRIHTNNQLYIKCAETDDNDILKLLPVPKVGNCSNIEIYHCKVAVAPLTDLLQHKLRLLNIESLLLEGVDFGINNLDINNIQMPMNLFAALENLQYLQLGYTNLTKLPVGIFQQQHKLKQLNLQHNKVQQLHKDVFSNATAIISLNLSANALQNLPADVFYWLIDLSELHLNGNFLEQLPTQLFAQNKNLQIVHLNNNQLKAVPATLFKNQYDLQFLDLSHNKLQSLPAQLLQNTKKLTVLKLSNNQLTKISVNILVNLYELQQLHLNNNQLRQMNDVFFFISNQSSTINYLTLSNNPWHCVCNSMPFVQFVRAKETMIMDIDSLYCNNNKKSFKEIKQLKLSDICQEQDHTLFITLAVILGFSIVLIAALCYKYKLLIKHYWQRCCNYLLDKQERAEAKNYDAYLSYAEKDAKFVIDKLLPVLENGAHPYKLCIHTRDFIVGEYISDQIIHAIDDSKRIILVLSPNFIESAWARMEFRIAYQAALKERRKRIIAIVYNDIVDFEILDPVLKNYLKSITYLKWGNPWFCKKLRNAMPQHTNRLNTSLTNEELEILAQSQVKQSVKCEKCKRNENNEITFSETLQSEMPALKFDIKNIKELIRELADRTGSCHDNMRKELASAVASTNENIAQLAEELNKLTDKNAHQFEVCCVETNFLGAAKLSLCFNEAKKKTENKNS